jgi:hypothetical protein
MQLYRIIYYSLAALHVSNDIFAHHQEHLNCITASAITHYVAASWSHGSVGTIPWLLYMFRVIFSLIIRSI